VFGEGVRVWAEEDFGSSYRLGWRCEREEGVVGAVHGGQGLTGVVWGIVVVFGLGHVCAG
jgi:hypothetical protein